MLAGCQADHGNFMCAGTVQLHFQTNSRQAAAEMESHLILLCSTC